MSARGFSVVIPLYNKREFVVEAVRSAAAEQPGEIIVVDDGSTDGSAELVADLGLPSVRLLRQANAGVAAARNTGLAAATGAWVAFLDADDRFQPGHLRTLQALAQRFPEAGMLATGYCRLLPGGRRVPVALPGGARLLHDFYRHWSRLTFTFTSAIAVNVQCVRRHAIQFPVGERLGEDQDVWFRVAELAPVAYAGTSLVDYRVEVAGSATAAVPRPASLLPCYLRLSQRVAEGITPRELTPGARRLLGSHWLNTARELHQRGDRAQAWALWRSPQARGHWTYWLRTGVAWLLGGH